MHTCTSDVVCAVMHKHACRHEAQYAHAYMQISSELVSQRPGLQVMVFQTLADKHGGLKKFSPTGTSVMVQGEIKATPEGVKQVPACTARPCMP